MSKLGKLLLGAVKSDTMKFNVGAAIVWFLTVLADSNFIGENPELTAIVGGVMALVNMILRAKTTKPLTER